MHKTQSFIVDAGLSVPHSALIRLFLSRKLFDEIFEQLSATSGNQAWEWKTPYLQMITDHLNILL